MLRIELAIAIGFSDLSSIPPETIPGLIASLKDVDPAVRRRATKALGQLGAYKLFMFNEAEARRIYGSRGKVGEKELYTEMPSCLLPAVDALADVVTRTRGDIRMAAIDALVEMRWGNDRSILALVEALKDDDPYIRARAATALGCCGTRVKPAVPMLRELARKDTGGLVRINAAVTLWEIDSNSSDWTGIVLECVLKDPNPYIRCYAITMLSLGRIGKDDKRIMTVMKAALQDKSEIVRKSARTYVEKNESAVSE